MPDEGWAYWERNAARYDRSMLLLGGPMRRMLSRLERDLRGAGSVLEIAAGTGLVTEVLARSAGTVLATDYAPAMVAELERRVRGAGLANVTCRVADVYALDVPESSFDAVVCANALHLVPDLEGALAAMHRVLRPGGRLVAPTFAHGESARTRLLSRIFAMTGFPGRRRLSVASLANSVRRAGFEVEARELIRGVMPIAWVTGRRREGAGGSSTPAPAAR